MEKTLKVYIYQEGERPIFHTPELKGIYASEGWFMKLLEGNKQYTTKDPTRAHLFYLPYSSRRLEYALYVPGSHTILPLSKFVKGYVEMLSAKYPFWNRTRGADHFFVACHDWVIVSLFSIILVFELSWLWCVLEGTFCHIICNWDA
jgi:Exostosin family